MCYLHMTLFSIQQKMIVLPSFLKHKLMLLSKCCVFKVRQYILRYAPLSRFLRGKETLSKLFLCGEESCFKDNRDRLRENLILLQANN